MANKPEKAAGWRAIAIRAYTYTLFFLIIYALFIGFKMSDMLLAKQEIGPMLKAAHVHTILESFLMLLIIYDLRHKRAENIVVSRAEEIIGLGVLGVTLVAAGFSIAALVPTMSAAGREIMHIGQPLLFFSLFFYIPSALIAEVSK